MRALLLLLVAPAWTACVLEFSEEVDCDRRCRLEAAHCGATDAELEACRGVCGAFELFEPGAYGDLSGNTEGCRVEHLLRAGEASDPAQIELSCARGSYWGDGRCGEPCEVWCGVGIEVCTAANELFGDAEPPEVIGAGAAQCVTACRERSEAEARITDATLECRVGRLVDGAEASVAGDRAALSAACEDAALAATACDGR